MLLKKSYDKSVDLFLFGLLVYELLVGVSAFPFREDPEEQTERIAACIFDFPGDE